MSQGDGQAVAVGIRVIGQQRGKADAPRDVRGNHPLICHGNRCIVHGSDRDGNGNDVSQGQPIAGTVGKAVGNRLAAVVDIGEGAIAAQRQGPVRRTRHQHRDERIAVRVRVVGQHAGCTAGKDRGHSALGHHYRIGYRHWRLIAGGRSSNRHRHAGRGRTAPAVANGVGEAVAAGEVGVRRVDRIARDGIHDHGTVGALGDAGNGQAVPIRIAVVPAHGDGDGCIGIGGGRIVAGHGHPVHENTQRAGRAGLHGVADGQRMAAAVVRIRLESEAAVCLQREGPAPRHVPGAAGRHGLAFIGEAGDHERPIGIGIVGQQIARALPGRVHLHAVGRKHAGVAAVRGGRRVGAQLRHVHPAGAARLQRGADRAGAAGTRGRRGNRARHAQRKAGVPHRVRDAGDFQP